jgi:hypothetical protein
MHWEDPLSVPSLRKPQICDFVKKTTISKGVVGRKVPTWHEKSSVTAP